MANWCKCQVLVQIFMLCQSYSLHYLYPHMNHRSSDKPFPDFYGAIPDSYLSKNLQDGREECLSLRKALQFLINWIFCIIVILLKIEWIFLFQWQFLSDLKNVKKIFIVYMQSYFSPYVAVKKGIIHLWKRLPKTWISVEKYKAPVDLLNIRVCWSWYYRVQSSVL